MRYRLPVLLLVVCLHPRPSLAQPSWARQPDRAERTGHTFICEGEGGNEVAALSAAYGVCNDKICKICGVEVESVLKTKETLSGISMERQVIERCRRVRKSEPKLQFKNVDCGPRGCRAWVQIFYSKAEEEAECPRYSSEKFADPGRCEADIDDFLAIRGRRALDFKARRDAMDRALLDCKNIDVRPTPALTAIDAKLHQGLNNFETSDMPTERRNIDDWAYFTHAAKGWRDDLRMTKTLVGRLQKIRDLVQDRYLIFSVYDAAWAKDLDSPTGVQRLLAAMERCPPGARFGALDDVNIAILYRLAKVKADTTAIGDFLRHAYKPESLHRLGYIGDQFMNEAFRIAAFFASDGKVSPAEWDYAMKIHQAAPCASCLSVLTRTRDHGSDKTRMKRILAAYEAIADTEAGSRHWGPSQILPDFDDEDPEFLLRIEPMVPKVMHAWYDAQTLGYALAAARNHHLPSDVQERIARRYAEALGQEPVTEKPQAYCRALIGRIDALEKQKLPNLEPAYKMMCWCLDRDIENFPPHGGPAQDMVSRSLAHGLYCHCPIDAKQTVARLTFGWKKGQTPRTYGPNSERKATFSVEVDPTWHSCAKNYNDRDARLTVHLYGGATADEALTSKRSILELTFRLDSAHDSYQFGGRFLCESRPAFVAYELKGSSEFAALNGRRIVVPIHCE